MFRLKFNQGKKGQMEMIGLVIIVILITLGMLFMVMFALKDEPTKKVFTRKELATSTMSALMKVTIDSSQCGEDYFSDKKLSLQGDLLEDCAMWKDSTDYSNYRCGNKHSCIFVKDFIAERLAETLGKWGKSYEFKFTFVGEEAEEIFVITDEKGGCARKQSADSSGSFFLPLEQGSGMAESILLICD